MFEVVVECEMLEDVQYVFVFVGYEQEVLEVDVLVIMIDDVRDVFDDLQERCGLVNLVIVYVVF